MSEYFVYIEDYSGEEHEIECEVTGGFHKETWGYHGGTPAEVPDVIVVSDLPEGITEVEVVEKVIEELERNMEHDDYHDRR